MEKARQHVRYLTFQELKDINEKTVLEEGGFADGAGRLANPNSLHYVVEAAQSRVFGVDLYPSIYLKAACYLYNIITRHVFIDGNKRTGLKAAFFFLGTNGYHEYKTISTNELVKFALNIARGKIDLRQTAKWLEERYT
jgi:death-on-curing protein